MRLTRRMESILRDKCYRGNYSVMTDSVRKKMKKGLSYDEAVMELFVEYTERLCGICLGVPDDAEDRQQAGGYQG